MILEFARNFKAPELERIANLPLKFHSYGKPLPISPDPFWITYYSNRGSISFLRDCSTFMPEFAEYTTEFIREHTGLIIEEDKINFIRTVGSYRPHIDTSRSSAINIGLSGADNGITRIGFSDSYDDFVTKYEEYRIQDGSAYLVNTSNVHEVEADTKKTVRYLVTVAVHEEFKSLETKIREFANGT